MLVLDIHFVHKSQSQFDNSKDLEQHVLYPSFHYRNNREFLVPKEYDKNYQQDLFGILTLFSDASCCSLPA
jgi:hypothetical protein